MARSRSSSPRAPSTSAVLRRRGRPAMRAPTAPRALGALELQLRRVPLILPSSASRSSGGSSGGRRRLLGRGGPALRRPRRRRVAVVVLGRHADRRGEPVASGIRQCRAIALRVRFRHGQREHARDPLAGGVEQHGLHADLVLVRRLRELHIRDAVLGERLADGLDHARQVGVLRLEEGVGAVRIAPRIFPCAWASAFAARPPSHFSP